MVEPFKISFPRKGSIYIHSTTYVKGHDYVAYDAMLLSPAAE
jgi:hypothetical protein